MTAFQQTMAFTMLKKKKIEKNLSQQAGSQACHPNTGELEAGEEKFRTYLAI